MLSGKIFKSPIRHFMKTKINGGAILLFVALAAMIIANTPWSEAYNSFFCSGSCSSIRKHQPFQCSRQQYDPDGHHQ